MDDKLYFDCERNSDGRPVRPHQRQRESQNQCVYCGVKESEPCRMAVDEGGQLWCIARLDDKLGEHELSETDISSADARALEGPQDNQNATGKTLLAEPGLTGSYRIRSPRERNYQKREIPKYARNDWVLMAVFRDKKMSRKEASDLYKAVRAKWRTYQKVRASQRRHALYRQHLHRLKKAVEDLKQCFVTAGFTSEEVDALFSDPAHKDPRFSEDKKVYEDYSEYAGRLKEIVGDQDWESLTEDKRRVANDWMLGLFEEAGMNVLRERENQAIEDITLQLLAKMTPDEAQVIDKQTLREEAAELLSTIELHKFLGIKH